MKKFFTKEVKIAVVAIIALCVLFFGMRFLKGMSLFSTDKTYYADFEDITGLSVSTPIYANGFRIGVVKDIRYDFSSKNDIVAEISLDKNFRMPKDSKAFLEASILGGSKVRLDIGVSNDYCQPGDTIFGGIDGGALSEAGEMVPEITKMLPRIDSIITNINILLANPALVGIEDNVYYVSKRLKASVDEINSLLAKTNREIPEILDNANKTMASASNVMAKVDDMDINATFAKIDATLDNVKNMTEKLNEGSGTLGAMINDKTLYNNLNASVTSLDSTLTSATSLLKDLQAHPKRYVHFSLFGRKDK